MDHPVVRSIQTKSLDFEGKCGQYKQCRLAKGNAGLTCIGGLDISFRSLESNDAVASLAVLSYPGLELLQVVSEVITMQTPYVPSFLSFREADPLVALITRYRTEAQVFFVDGNGRLHERECGSATAVGVAANLPTIGIAKEYHPIDRTSPTTFRSSQKGFREVANACLKSTGDWLAIPAGSTIVGAVSR